MHCARALDPGHVRRRWSPTPWLLLLGSLTGCQVYPGSQAPVTPQRPTFASYTTTAAPATMEQETGFSVEPGDRFTTPTTLRYGSGPATEIFLSVSPFNYVSNPTDPSEIGFGDLDIGVRHRLCDESPATPAWALEASIKLPTAGDTEGLGTGELDARFAAIQSRVYGESTVTGYYELGLLGNSGSGIDVGFAGSIVGDLPLDDDVTGFLELAGILVAEQDRTEIFTTIGVAYRPSPSVVVDGAVTLGVDDAPDLGILFGITQNIGRPLF